MMILFLSAVITSPFQSIYITIYQHTFISLFLMDNGEEVSYVVLSPQYDRLARTIFPVE